MSSFQGKGVEIIFKATIGGRKNEVKRVAAPDILLQELIVDVAKKFNIVCDSVALATISGHVLTPDDFELSIRQIRRIYGDTLTIINRAVVG
ncbi:MAG: hypothetical protein GF308_10005 [Candidatus Heimdallarchaeota archaeon]|nr:hypothetical protein [Candidatus Heimdallarchaeota archaeon]